MTPTAFTLMRSARFTDKRKQIIRMPVAQAGNWHAYMWTTNTANKGKDCLQLVLLLSTCKAEIHKRIFYASSKPANNGMNEDAAILCDVLA